MTVSARAPSITYIENGATTAFAVNFRFLSAAELIVKRIAPGGTVTTLAAGTDYSTTGGETDAGGTLTTSVAAVAGTKLVIRRETARTQTADYTDSDTFPAQSHERALDRAMLIDQEQDVKIADTALRAIMVPEGETIETLAAAAVRSGKFLGFGAAGVLALLSGTGADAGLRSDLATSTGLALIGALRDGAGSVARSARDIINGIAISIEDKGGGAGKSASANTQALLDAVATLPDGGVIRFEAPGATYAMNPVSIGNSGITLDLSNRVTLSFAALGMNTSAITINASDFMVRGGKITGPTTGAYVGNENGLTMIGSSTANRKSGLIVDKTEISNFGAHAIYAQFVDDVDVQRCFLHDCGYAGAMFLSCNHGKFIGNKIKTIGPGTAGSMYGIAVTHDSTGYAGGGKAATHPFSWNWTITFNWVEDINWEGIDTHGCYEVRVNNNAVYNTERGIAITGSSGDALAFAGYTNSVIGNVIDGRKSDGTASGRENLNYGININGATTTTQNRVNVIGNILVCKGLGSNPNSGVIQAVRSTNIVIGNNIIDQWQGTAILVTLAGGTINHNQIGARSSAGDTIGQCIADRGPSTYRLTIEGNTHDPLGGTAALSGFVQTGGATVRPVLTGNNFSAAGNAWSLSATGFCLGADVMPVVNDGSAATALDLAELKGGPGIVHLSNAGARSIQSFTGAREGQRVLLLNQGAGNQTVTRTNAALSGGVDQVMTTHDMLELYFVTATAARQIAPLAANA